MCAFRVDFRGRVENAYRALFPVEQVDQPVQKPGGQHLCQESKELIVEADGVQRMVVKDWKLYSSNVFYETGDI